MPKKILITTAIDYTNDVIHLGHAYQKVLADCLSRYYRQKLGKDAVFFLTGTDEFGTTTEKAALARGLSPKEHCDDIVQKNLAEWKTLNLSFNRFIRTTDPDHQKIASDFFKKSYEAGDIYKGKYQGLYCEGCEAYKTLSELNEEGQCVLHPTRQIQKLDEENYFFRWGKYAGGQLQDTMQILPEAKRKEMLSLIEQGINDIPVTRPKYKVSWGIPCPIDDTQVIYVWFDALINYYTSGSQTGFWDEDTEIIHILGKDNARWHTVLWPAMLKSVGYRLPSKVYIHSFILLNGQKISKSRGNIIKPSQLVQKFGTDAVRYYLLKYGPLLDDVDISEEKIEEVYNNELANNLGNLVSRVAKLMEGQEVKTKSSVCCRPSVILGSEATPESEVKTDSGRGSNLARMTGTEAKIQENIEDFRPDLALQEIQLELNRLNKTVQESKPWEKEGKERETILIPILLDLLDISDLLEPFIPQTVEKIREVFTNGIIKPTEPLFPRIKKGSS